MKQYDELSDLKFWLNLIIESGDYREIINRILDCHAKNMANFSIQNFANSGGLKSKSTILDIKSGRRRITYKNLANIIKALRIPSDLHHLFRLKVALEEIDLESTMSLEEVKDHYDKTVKFLQERFVFNTKNEDIFDQNLWPIIFAALNENVSSEFEMIASRTRIPKLELRYNLQHMVLHQLIIEKDDGYVVNQSSLPKFQQAHNKNYQKYFLHTLTKVEKQVKTNFSDQSQIFITADLCINPQDVAHFRSKLKQFLSEHLPSLERQDGSRVCTLNISLTLSDEL